MTLDHRPRLLDLFSGAGGAARGYQLAGFHVTGVDINPQPRYAGDEFVQADAMTFPLDGYDAIHASPPCRDHTWLTSLAGYDGSAWMLPATRARLEKSGLPYVIENVMGADMRRDLLLCGGMFGLRTYRHRQFEAGGGVKLEQPPHPAHVARTATKQRRERWAQGWHVSITGDVGVYVGPEAMGIDWMSGNELSQAIPPAYSELVGGFLLAAIRERVAS